MTDLNALKNTIETAFEGRANITPAEAPQAVRDAVNTVLGMLDAGQLRVAERRGVGDWVVNEWLKKAVLLSFRLNPNEVVQGGDLRYFDKVPTKFANWNQAQFEEAGIRVVPNAVARRGSFIAKGAVLMPSYVNIGAYVDEGTMVDTWATVGSCAQIGKNVHL
ncbi:MAG: 2,3,4,5-tetrahydropyridine-2,6-dicarboxylate N-succinyltransferase, partial [Halothiobacillus sp. 13-55-115]